IADHEPDLILIPVNPQAEAVSKLEDTLRVIEALEQKQPGLRMKVRVVPLGSKLAEIRGEIARIQPSLNNFRVMPRVRELAKETNQARRERKDSWEIEGV